MAKKKRTKKAPKKGRRSLKKPLSPSAREVKVWLAALFLLVFLVGSMAVLQMLRESLTGTPAIPVPVVEQPVAPQIETYPQLARIEPPASPTPLAPEVLVVDPMPVPPGEYWVAIIVDDLGQDLTSARALLDIDLALTFAVLPDLPYSTRVAHLAASRGREVILHIPMQPQDYPAKNPGHNALLTDLSEDEIRRRLAAYLAQVPEAVGGNNHMGSAFTRDRAGMRVVMSEFAERGLFFVDSLTTGGSLVSEVANEFDLPRGVRDVFLDNEADVAQIRKELRRLIRLAKRNGSAIAIGHPYPETIEALRLEQASFAREGVRVVPVSYLLRRG
jgi:uncharacterized protein